jgi:uncharacterized protein (UPF0332 family)
MESKKLVWCFKLKDGLRMTEPNEILSKSYLEHAKSSLLRSEKDLNDKDFLWATVAIYYSEYYSLYSFLQRIGIKCENHSCSILAVTLLLGEEKIRTINSHKDKRLDAQYYMKVEQEDKIREMLKDAKLFVAQFDEIVSNLNEKEIKDYRDIIERNK